MSELDEVVERYRSRFKRMFRNANRARLTGIVDPQRIGMYLTRLLESMVIRKARKYMRRHDTEEAWNVLLQLQYWLWYFRFIPIDPPPPTVDADLLKLMREAVSRLVWSRLTYRPT